MIKLGDRVRDKITGFTGIAVARTEWLYGCIRWVVQPQELHDQKPVDGVGFDEDQLEVVQDKASENKAPKPGGGDRDYIPTRH